MKFITNTLQALYTKAKTDGELFSMR